MNNMIKYYFCKYFFRLFIVKSEYYIYVSGNFVNTNQPATVTIQSGLRRNVELVALIVKCFQSVVHPNVFFHLPKCLLSIVVNALYKH